jgi:electron transfer flavoprotein beta subunit
MTMKILVPVKRVVDANVRVRIGSAGSVDTAGLKMSLNPFDECAVEQALRLRETGVASSVTVLTCGLPVCQDVLRTALAMGADNAVLIDTANASPDSLGIARLLHAFITADTAADADTDAYGLVLCGKQAIDDDIGGVAAMLAALLGWPQALNASAMEADGSSWRVTCGDDAGTATWRLDGPAVVSADLRLAEPRRVTLPSIVKAKQKALRTLDTATLDVALGTQIQIVGMAEPAVRQPGIKVADTAALLGAIGSERLFQNVGA